MKRDTLHLALGMIVLSYVHGAALAESDPVIRVNVTGRLTIGVVAVGGETTGTAITAKGITWELDFRGDRSLEDRADRLADRLVTVTGSLERVAGVERGPRDIVRVDSLSLADGTSASGDTVPLEVQGRRADTRAQVESQQRTVVDIFSPFGIDVAQVRRRRNQWPSVVILRLHLAALEGFHARQGELVLERAPNAPSQLWLRRGSEQSPEVVMKDAGRIVRKEADRDTEGKHGFFEIHLPAQLFANNPTSITLQWVDYYR